MTIDCIDHFVITTGNIDECIRLYSGILGIRHVEKDGRHAFLFGSQKINVHTRKGEFQPAALHPGYGTQDICLLVEEDVGKLKSELGEKGLEVIEGVVSRHGAQGMLQSIYLRDTDGNLVELANPVKVQNS